MPLDSSVSGQGRFEIVRGYPLADLEQQWRKCLLDVDFATHYTTPEYFHEPFFQDRRPFAVLSMAGEEVAAICTGIHYGRSIKCGLRGRPQVAISRSAHRETAVTGLVAGLREESRSCDLIDVFAWSELPGVARWGFRERKEEGAVVLDLSLGSDALFKKFSATRRTDIRKAIKGGVIVDIAASKADVAAFYEIYRGWVVRKGLPIQTWEQIDKAISLTANRRLFLARHQGKVVAGIIVRFAPGGVMEYAANSSLKESLDLHPNDLLNWRAIEWACAQGLRIYSLGATHLFLRKFGGPIAPNYRYRLDRTFFRTHTVRDLASEFARISTTHAPPQLVALGRRLRDRTASR